MKRLWSGVITATVVATVGLGAQVAPGAQSSSPAGAQGREQSRPTTQSGAQTITVTGCVQRAPAASASAGAEGAKASASADAFILANAKMASTAGAAGGAVGTSGTAASRYELDGDPKTLTGHVAHQVEVTGTLESSPSSAPGAAAPRAGAAASAPAPPKLKVDSVKMVSATCP